MKWIITEAHTAPIIAKRVWNNNDNVSRKHNNVVLDSSARSRDEMINILWFELAAEQEELNS